jgi:hypothetical protein
MLIGMEIKLQLSLVVAVPDLGLDSNKNRIIKFNKNLFLRS